MAYCFSLKILYKNQVVNKRIEFVAIFLQTAYFTTEWYILDRFIHHTALIELAFRQPEKILVILSDSEHLVLHNKMFD
ncbi:MAG: hypothetical protein IJR44_07015 [Neisseriaceae bacterium]|nr:hypothetical protein [Neisseriaceae bacterium]